MLHQLIVPAACDGAGAAVVVAPHKLNRPPQAIQVVHFHHVLRQVLLLPGAPGVAAVARVGRRRVHPSVSVEGEGIQKPLSTEVALYARVGSTAGSPGGSSAPGGSGVGSGGGTGGSFGGGSAPGSSALGSSALGSSAGSSGGGITAIWGAGAGAEGGPGGGTRGSSADNIILEIGRRSDILLDDFVDVIQICIYICIPNFKIIHWYISSILKQESSR